MLAVKVLIGGVLVLAIHLVSQSKSFYLSGLIPLFPTFALIACYSVGQEQPAANLKETVLFAMLSLIPYFVYLLSVFLLAEKCSLLRCLCCSSAAWVVVAGVLILSWEHYRPLKSAATSSESVIHQNTMHVPPSGTSTYAEVRGSPSLDEPTFWSST